jgi:RNA polymerase sigma-70 factor (ECF subfamily)
MSLKPGGRSPSKVTPDSKVNSDAPIDLNSSPIRVGGVIIGTEPSLWYEKYAPLVKFIVAKYVRNRADQEELCQDAWIRIMKSLDNYDPSKSEPHTWVAKLTRCTVIDKYRRRKARIEPIGLQDTRDESAPFGELKAPSVAAARGRLEELIAGEDAARTIDDFSSIRPEQAETLRLVYKYGLTMAEASEATGNPLGTTKSLVSRGLARLRRTAK